MKTPEQCMRGIGEYREDVIGRRQHEVARIVERTQPFISQIEIKYVPPKWTRDKMIIGYQKPGIEPLTDEQFVMLIERGIEWNKAQRELKRLESELGSPMSATHPLLATALATTPADVQSLRDAAMREAQHVLMIQQRQA